MWLRALTWIGLLGEGLVILFVLAILFFVLRARLTPFKKKLKARRAKENEARRRRASLEESVRTYLVPALSKLGFEPAPPRAQDDSEERKYSGCFPLWGRLIRRRELVVDQAEIQFATYGRAAFRVKTGAAPKDGMITYTGHWAAEDVYVGWLHEHYVTHARPWLRPILRKLRVEPLGAWFSLWRLPVGSPTSADYDKLAQRAAGVLPELELALREGKLGPHILRFEMKPLPPEVLERVHQRIEKLKAEGKWTTDT